MRLITTFCFVNVILADLVAFNSYRNSVNTHVTRRTESKLTATAKQLLVIIKGPNRIRLTQWHWDKSTQSFKKLTSESPLIHVFPPSPNPIDIHSCEQLCSKNKLISI